MSEQKRKFLGLTRWPNDSDIVVAVFTGATGLDFFEHDNVIGMRAHFCDTIEWLADDVVEVEGKQQLERAERGLCLLDEAHDCFKAYALKRSFVPEWNGDNPENSCVKPSLKIS